MTTRTSVFMRWKWVWLNLGLASVSLAAVGCGYKGDVPPLYPVHGKVTLDGQPLDRAVICLIPDTGPSSGGITNPDGTYELQHRYGQKGAPPGRTKVFITTVSQDEKGNPTPELLPKKYNEQTTLEFTVLEGDNEQNFDLTTKPNPRAR